MSFDDNITLTNTFIYMQLLCLIASTELATITNQIGADLNDGFVSACRYVKINVFANS